MNIAGAAKVLTTGALFCASMQFGWPLFVQVLLGVIFVVACFAVSEPREPGEEG